ncbi:hypothetical protein EMCG_06579 [[Emmonsia] crescens]|uniref:LysM domain-containing protein n=1 Tax=[Emmonsia] crescens TaxID=73230 RepID=A0A0G2IAR0_9EURO|nr:hypothetical protein EMCG_06579 [Emmonsia crescens UAMH 3008]
MQSFILLFFGLVSVQQVIAEFNFYAKYEEGDVTTTIGVSGQCLSALNQTIDCDAVNVARAASGADDDFWFRDNVTTLCTMECSNALTTWLSDVESQCAGDQIITDGRFIEPYTIPLKYIAGYDMACLQDRWGSDLCYGDDPPPHCDDQVLVVADATSDPDKMSVTNMYSRDLFCSECFMLMWRQRLLSPILSPGKFAEYLVDQFNKIKASCLDSPGPAPAAPGTNEAPTPVEKRANGIYYKAATPAFPTQPGAIEDCGHYYNVVDGDTCGSISSNLGISIYDIKSFNTELDRTCSNLWTDHAICVAPIEKEPISTDGNCGEGYEACNSNNRCGPCNRGDSNPEDAAPVDPTPNNPAPGDFTPSSTTPSNTNPRDGAQDDSATAEPTRSADGPAPVDPTPARPVPPKETGLPDNTTMSISIDGKCALDISCTGSGFGDCCSTSGFCGTGPEWCSIGNCLAGACEKDTTGISFDGTCGPLFPDNRTCVDSKFGDCCSVTGYCGTGPGWCGYGNCYSGVCDTSLGSISTDGTCGPKFAGNMTCVGSTYGECCSTSGFCGSSSRHCGILACYSGKCEGNRNDKDDKDNEDKVGEDKDEEYGDEEDEEEDEDADEVED